MIPRAAAAWALVTLAACGRPAAPSPPPPAPAPATAVPAVVADAALVAREPVAPPGAAWAAGLMPLAATGVPEFRALRPNADGRGVLIAILDSGIDPATLGLITTSQGTPKVLDLRDFSGEGRVPLTAVVPEADGTVLVVGRRMAGARRAGRIAVGSAWYGGVFRELPLGPLPAADVNGNGTNTDEFPLVVVRAAEGWAVFLDTNRDGSFEDEMPLHDFRHARETISLGTRPLTLAANFADSAGVPSLDLYFDTAGHGTFVAGVAAGHNMFNVTGFHGVAPGARLLGLKIANNARGGISVSGSFGRALEYAARFAAERSLPLVVNLSFGVGNEREGRATIDSMVDAFLARHPDVVFAVSAGNDGPGLSTVGFPATADLAFTVGSTFPGVFARPGGPPVPERVAAWSARGGEAGKPDVVAPGMAFSTVPAWDMGNEVQAGTSFSAPHVAGLVACLISALEPEGLRIDAAQLMQALRVTARPLAGASALDQGGGVPRLDAAYRWLVAGHQGSIYAVRARSGWSAALRRDGLRGSADTLETFTVRHAAGLRAARFVLRSDAPWLTAPDTVVAAPGATEIPVSYRADRLRAPGAYVGTVTGRNPGDTLAGPLFTLVSTVIVPHDLLAQPLDVRRRIAPGRVERHFLRVPAAGATLDVIVTLPDSATETAGVSLFEPGGQPFRDAPAGQDLGAEGGTARFVVRAEDVVPGVYELDVVASPLGPPDAATVTVRAELAPVTLSTADGGLEMANPGPAPAVVRVGQQLVGVERRVRVRARGAVPESLAVDVPAWARRGDVDVVVAPTLWPEFTDLGVTVFDTAGQQVATEPQNYAIGRQVLRLADSHGGSPLTVELFPAWADPAAARPWEATVTVRFFLDRAVPLPDTADVRVPPGGRASVARGAAASPLVPAGFDALVEITGEGGDGRAAVVRREGVAP